MKLRRTKEPMSETNFRASEIPASTNGGPAVNDDATPLPELGDVGPLLTRHQVAELLNVSPTTVWRLASYPPTRSAARSGSPPPTPSTTSNARSLSTATQTQRVDEDDFSLHPSEPPPRARRSRSPQAARRRAPRRHRRPRRRARPLRPAPARAA